MRVRDFKEESMKQCYLLSYDVINLPKGKQTFRDYLIDNTKFKFLTDSSCVFYLDKYYDEATVRSFIQKKFKKYKLENDLNSETYLNFVCAPCLDNFFIYSNQAS